MNQIVDRVVTLESKIDINDQQKQLTLAELINRDMKSLHCPSSSCRDCHQTIENGLKESLNEINRQFQRKLQPVSLKNPSKQVVMLGNPHQITIPSQGYCIVSGDLRKLKEDKNLIKKERRRRLQISKIVDKKAAELREIESSSSTKNLSVVSEVVNTQHEFLPTKHLNANKYDQIRVWMIQTIIGKDMANHPATEIKFTTNGIRENTNNSFNRKRKIQQNESEETARRRLS